MIDFEGARSPAWSEGFALLALGVISAVVLLILRYYLPLRTTPAFYLLPIFFSLWLPAGIVLLVPIDLASRAKIDDEAARGIWLPDRVLLVSWRITYWLTFALTWFFLPLLAEYSDAGYREPKDKLIYSLRENAQYHAIIIGSAVVGLVYVFITYGVSLLAIRSLVMALAYCWGLVLAIYLMGHGLVSIPRSLFRNASLSGRLRRLQLAAPRLYEKLEDAQLGLEDVEAQISALSKRTAGSASKHRDWIEELADLANVPESVPAHHASRGTGNDPLAVPAVITEKYLADLTRRLVRARQLRSRYASEWTRLVEAAVWTQAVIDSAASKKLHTVTVPVQGAELVWSRPALSSFSLLTPHTRHLLHYYWMPYLQSGLAVVLSIASACIVWSEVVKVGLPQLSVIRLSVVHYWEGPDGQVGFTGQMIASVWILYMCAAALTSVTEVRVWRGRALVRRQTMHESALWYAGQVAKLTIPLSYNFLTFLSPHIYKQTAFYDFLGRLIDLTQLGSWFDFLFPAFILFPVCATLFGLYGRVHRLVGFGSTEPIGYSGEDGDGEDGDGEDGRPLYSASALWREGRDLIARELGGDTTARRLDEALSHYEVEATTAAPRSSPTPAAATQRQQQRRPGAPTVSAPGASSSRRAAAARRPPPSLPSPPPPAPPAPPWAGRAGGAWQPPAQDEDADEDADEDPSFLQTFGHRVVNTIETLEPPRWLQGIARPKWMAAPAAARSQAGAATDRSVAALDIRRWFGGGGDGRVRL